MQCWYIELQLIDYATFESFPGSYENDEELGSYYPLHLRILEEEWHIIELGYFILKPIMIAQKHLEGELYVTNSWVAPMISIIRQAFEDNLNEAMTNEYPQSVILGIKSTIESFCERFGEEDGRVLPAISIPEPHFYRISTPFGEATQGIGRRPQGITIFQALATFCDPRFRLSSWLPDDEHATLRNIAIDYTFQLAMNDNLDSYCQPQRDNSGRKPIRYERPPQTFRQRHEQNRPNQQIILANTNPFWKSNGGDVERLATNSNDDMKSQIVSEVDDFLTLNIPQAQELTMDILKWWRETGKKKFPNLAHLAHDVFSVPATSAPTERLVSSASHIDRQERNRILPENLADLLFAKATRQFEARFGKIPDILDI